MEVTQNDYTIADIFRSYFSLYEHRFGSLPKHHYDIAHAIMQCRTEVLGGHIYK